MIRLEEEAPVPKPSTSNHLPPILLAIAFLLFLHLQATAEEPPESFLESIDLSLEADLELSRETYLNETTFTTTFDEVNLAAETDLWSTELGLNYDTSGGGELRIEEAWLAFGGTESFPPFLQLGRATLPFAEFDTNFIEDPHITTLGETDEDALLLGYDDDQRFLTLGAFQGESGTKRDLDLFLVAGLSDLGPASITLGWTGDLAESMEFRDLRADHLSETDGAAPPAHDPTPAIAITLALDIEPADLTINLGYAGALDDLPAGFAQDDILHPHAWACELAWELSPRWLLAARAEGSDDLPGSSEHSWGVAGVHRLGEHLGISADYVVGDMPDGGPYRHVVNFKLSVSF